MKDQSIYREFYYELLFTAKYYEGNIYSTESTQNIYRKICYEALHKK